MLTDNNPPPHPFSFYLNFLPTSYLHFSKKSKKIGVWGGGVEPPPLSMRCLNPPPEISQPPHPRQKKLSTRPPPGKCLNPPPLKISQPLPLPEIFTPHPPPPKISQPPPPEIFLIFPKISQPPTKITHLPLKIFQLPKIC